MAPATYNGMQQEYYFPIPKASSKQTRSLSGFSPEKVKSHSRQYTVCLGESFVNGHESSNSMSKLAAPPLFHEHKSSSDASSIQSSPRRHAHKRSAAISHDFSAELRQANKDAMKDSQTTLNGPSAAGTGGCNSTTLAPPSVTVTATPSSVSATSATTAASLSNPSLTTFASSTSSLAAEPRIEPPTTAKPLHEKNIDAVPKLNSSRHKKVKSWASGIMNLKRLSMGHSSKPSKDLNELKQSKQPKQPKQLKKTKDLKDVNQPTEPEIDSLPQEPNFVASQESTNTDPGSSVFSSSYVPSDLLHSPTKATKPLLIKEPEPVIDLDFELSLSSGSHRRCDSAPESTYLSSKQLRHKMLEETVPEVEEEDDDGEGDESQSEGEFHSPQPRYSFLGSPYKSSVNNASSVSIGSAHSYERKSRYSRHSPRLSTSSPSGSQVRSLSAVTGNELKKKSSQTLMPPPFKQQSQNQGQTIIAVNNKLKFSVPTSDSSSAESVKMEPQEPKAVSVAESEYNDTFYLGGPGYVRYSIDSDRLSYYTVDSKVATSINSNIPADIPPVPSPKSLHSSTMNNLGVYANKTQPVVGSRPKASYQRHQYRSSILSIKSTDARSIMSGSSIKKGANRMYDWFKHKSFA